MTERTPSELRRLLRLLLETAGLEPITDDVLFVVSELVTNVWKHTDGHCHFAVHTSQLGVHILIRDYSRDLPMGGAVNQDNESGRGILAVDQFATTYAVQELPDGKIVAAFLAAPKQVEADVVDQDKGGA
ncbi:ATP-binding protein [Streptomyces sp. NPDC052236]|uniref:ATP-binding protein n=1 Tax=Streptomyces sp. NPDC052236 TaxID=3365686 RepID=UPI0037CF5D06